MQDTIKAYCSGSVDNIEVVNLRHINEILAVFKNMYNFEMEAAKTGANSQMLAFYETTYVRIDSSADF